MMIALGRLVSKDELDRMRGELTDLEEQSRVLERFYAENTVMLARTAGVCLRWPSRR